MNLQAILVANLTGFILLVFLFISRLMTRTKRQAEDPTFEVMLFLAGIACLIEPLTFFVDGKPGKANHLINLLGNTYLYFANCLGSFFWCMYVDKCLYHSRERIRRIYYKLSGVVVLVIFSLVINIWKGFYFIVDSDNLYHRQPLSYAFFLYVFSCCIFSVVVTYVHRYRHGKTAFFPIFMFLVPIVAGSVAQMLFYGVSLAWLGASVGTVALYMSLLNRRSYIDMLTGLYNRQYLEHFIYEMQKSSGNFYGIMIDMDFFKEINDQFGHSAGDRALNDMADVIREACDDRYQKFFRYAGDEFIILVKAEEEKEVIEFESKLHDIADRFNRENDRPYKIGFSAGHALYDRENDTEDSFLKHIDTAMYKKKEIVHRERSLTIDRRES